MFDRISPNKDKWRIRLMVRPLMAYRGKNVQTVADEQSLAYNTVLGYWRETSEKVSLRVLDKIAQALEVDPWILLYQGQWARPLVKIAQAVGVEYQGPTQYPVTTGEYEALFRAIAQKVGVELSEDDFGPLDQEG